MLYAIFVIIYLRHVQLMMVQRIRFMKAKLVKPVFFTAVLFFAIVILGCAAGGDTLEYTVK